MSWRKQRVYKCDVCGKLQPVSRYNHGAPAFWRHTGNRYGFTIRNWLGMDVDECWLHASRETGALGKELVEPNGFCAWGERRES